MKTAAGLLVLTLIGTSVAIAFDTSSKGGLIERLVAPGLDRMVDVIIPKNEANPVLRLTAAQCEERLNALMVEVLSDPHVVELEMAIHKLPKTDPRYVQLWNRRNACIEQRAEAILSKQGHPLSYAELQERAARIE